jgi:hypothetical protein
VLKQRFEALRRQHEAEAGGTARKSPADPNAYDLAALNEAQRKTLIRFWEAWQETLKCLLQDALPPGILGTGRGLHPRNRN